MEKNGYSKIYIQIEDIHPWYQDINMQFFKFLSIYKILPKSNISKFHILDIEA